MINEIMEMINIETRRIACEMCGMKCSLSEVSICTMLVENGLIDKEEYIETMKKLTSRPALAAIII